MACFFIFLTFLSFNNLYLNGNLTNSTLKESDENSTSVDHSNDYHLEKLTSLTDHDPIYIMGNTNFDQQAQNEGWPGNGSASNPYIIENYRIVNSSDVDGIYISSTTLNYIIRNNYISMNGSTSRGIYIASQPTSGTINITNNILDNNNNTGLYLYQTTHTIVSNNSIINNSQYGINSQYSDYVNFTDNLISG